VKKFKSLVIAPAHEQRLTAACIGDTILKY